MQMCSCYEEIKDAFRICNWKPNRVQADGSLPEAVTWGFTVEGWLEAGWGKELHLSENGRKTWGCLEPWGVPGDNIRETHRPC